MSNERNQSGFSLIEIIVVIGIMAILVGIGSTFYSGYIQRGRDDRRILDVGLLQEALGRYHSNQVGGFYPLDLHELVVDGYLDRRPVDPLTALEDDYQYTPLPVGCDNGVGNYCSTYLIVVDLEAKGDRFEAGSNDIEGTIIP